MKKLGLVTPPKPNSWIPKNDATFEAGDNKTPKSTITGSFMTTIFWWVFETLSDWLHPKPSFGGKKKEKNDAQALEPWSFPSSFSSFGAVGMIENPSTYWRGVILLHPC